MLVSIIAYRKICSNSKCTKWISFYLSIDFKIHNARVLYEYLFSLFSAWYLHPMITFSYIYRINTSAYTSLSVGLLNKSYEPFLFSYEIKLKHLWKLCRNTSINAFFFTYYLLTYMQFCSFTSDRKHRCQSKILASILYFKICVVFSIFILITFRSEST